MDRRITYFLFAAVVVVLVIFVVVLTWGPRGGEEFVFPDLRGKGKPEDVAEVAKTINKVEIERMQPSGDALLFERQVNGWILTKPYSARIDSAAIDQLVDSLVTARLDKKASIPAKSETGLDSPSAAITLIRGDKSYRLDRKSTRLNSSPIPLSRM